MSLRFVPTALLLAVLLGPLVASRANDVPENVQDLYAEALAHESEGDLKAAYTDLSKARSKNPLSVDFWELYVRVWRGLDKEEDVLWEKIIGKVEKKFPKTAVFLVLRARLTDDGEERIAVLRQAVAKDPAAIEPQLLLAKAVLADGDDIEAGEILERLLAKHPGHEEALVTRGELDLEQGRSLSALDYADERLQTHDLPGLHDLRARALLVLAESESSRLEEAEAAARRAVIGRADPRYVRTLVTALDRKGDLDGAVKLLDEYYAKTHAPVLAAKLGELAFRQGDYERAARGLAADPDPSVAVLKGLAVCHARLGDLEAARRLLPRIRKRTTEDAASWEAEMEIHRGSPEAALAALGDSDAEGTTFLRLWANAKLGRVEPVREIAAERAGGGERGDEEFLTALLYAQLMDKLGAKGADAQRLLLDEKVAAAKAHVPSATVPTTEREMRANSPGFIERAITYRRSLGGEWFSATFDEDDITIEAEPTARGTAKVRLGVRGRSACPLEPERWFFFNPQELDPSIVENADAERLAEQILLKLFGDGDEESWERTAASFKSGCEAAAEGEWAKAQAAFQMAVQGEPQWGRAQLFAAVAQVLGGGDVAEAEASASKALDTLPDDWDAQRLVVLVQRLAGVDARPTAKRLAEREEAHCCRHLAGL